jgi:hypothetical protein
MANDHALRLGKLVANQHSLEVLLRIYLLKTGSGDSGKKPYWDLIAGEEIDDDEFSNYDSLGQLVEKFNARLAQKDPSLMVDSQVVEVRDLIAHGRVAGTAEDTSTLKILKFAKPAAGKARVTVCVLMDDAWLDCGIRLYCDQILKVGKAIDTYAI